MQGKTQVSAPTTIVCPTCSARYAMPRYVEGQKYGCQRCSASLFFGKFALLQELGRGGFGVVYKAWQADLERTVALKFLHSDSEESGERFIREARIAANLAHPNITAIYEAGKHEGKLYITMQYVDGTTTNRLDLSPREAAQVVRDAALAVDYAHARDIVHRDLKPHNIMVTEERSGTTAAQTSKRVFVMDFGLARSVTQGSSLTAEGQVMGTPAFMSPEQAEGGACDARSDVYSLGATLYALVTRRSPVEAETPVQILMKVCQGAITPPRKAMPDIDPNLEAILLKAMARDPGERYPTAARLAADLSMWLQGSTPDAGATVHLSASSKVVRGGAASRRKTGPVLAAVAALLVAGAGAVWFLRRDAGLATPGDFTALLVESEPRGAAVSIEGIPRTWTTPAEIRSSELGPSPATVTLTMAGRRSLTRRNVAWTREQPGVVREVLEPEPPPLPLPPSVPEPTEVLQVLSEPPGAAVRAEGLEGREWKTPIHLTDRDLPPGEHVIHVALRGYRPASRPVTVVRGRSLPLAFRLEKAPPDVAFRVSSDPKGARVLLNEREVGLTPCEVFRDQVPEAAANLEVRMAGYDSVLQRKSVEERPVDVAVVLKRQTGAFLLSGAAPRAEVRAFPIPPGLGNAGPLALLWSENPASVERALAAIVPAEAAFVTARLAELSKRPEPGISGPAARLAGTPPAPEPMKPESSLPADVAGRARIEGAWVLRRYVLLASAPGAKDFLAEDLQPEKGQELKVVAEMPALVRVSVRTRPALGTFTAVLADGTRLPVVSGAPALLVPAGPLVLEYAPPPGDPLLCKLTATKQVTEAFELTGNLYVLSGIAFENDGDAPRAVRSYAKGLEEKAPEDPERAKLPERIRKVYRDWADGRLKKGRALGPDARRRAEELRKDPSAPTGLLLDLYSAEDATRESRGAAAAGLAMAHARLKQPFEAMEWLERALREGTDPGAEAEAAVAALARGAPGLGQRGQDAVASIAALRKAALRKPVYLGLRTSGVAERGVRVDGIAKGSPAAAAGFQFGELVIEVRGLPVRTPEELDAAVEAAGAGAELEVKVDRLGEPVAIAVKLAEAPAQAPEFLQPPPRVGVVQLVHEKFGTFVKLDEGAQAEPGDLLEVTRNGERVGELTVGKLLRADAIYTHGGAECRPGRGSVRKEDEVRKARK